MNKLWQKTRALFVSPPASPTAISLPKIDEIENVEVVDQEESEETISGRLYVIEYTDRSKVESVRRITCRKMFRRNETLYLQARCHERQATRSFLVDSIRCVIDPISGEVLSTGPAEILKFRIDEAGGAPWQWSMSVRLMADLTACLNGLIFLSRCDGNVHLSEKEVAEKFVAAFWLRFGTKNDLNITDVLNYYKRLVPDGEIFISALHRISKNNELTVLFRNYAVLLVEADGRLDKMEFYWLDAMDSIINSHDG